MPGAWQGIHYVFASPHTCRIERVQHAQIRKMGGVYSGPCSSNTQMVDGEGIANLSGPKLLRAENVTVVYISMAHLLVDFV